MLIFPGHGTGRDFGNAARMHPLIKDAGFIDTHHEKLKVPYGLWPADPKQKEMGAYLLLTSESAFGAFGYGLLTRAFDMRLEDVENLIRGARADSRSRKIHSYSRQ